MVGLLEIVPARPRSLTRIPVGRCAGPARQAAARARTIPFTLAATLFGLIDRMERVPVISATAPLGAATEIGMASPEFRRALGALQLNRSRSEDGLIAFLFAA
jgi:hypothetical protein